MLWLCWLGVSFKCICINDLVYNCKRYREPPPFSLNHILRLHLHVQRRAWTLELQSVVWWMSRLSAQICFHIHRWITVGSGGALQPNRLQRSGHTGEMKMGQTWKKERRQWIHALSMKTSVFRSMQVKFINIFVVKVTEATCSRHHDVPPLPQPL